MAAPACYSVDEAEAEQGLRLQSEMMMVGMACSKANSYRAFNNAHVDLWQDYEETLQKFFKVKTKSKNGAKDVSNLRAKFANETSLRMAQISRPLFCRMHQQSFKDLKNRTNEQLRVKLRLAPMHAPLSTPRCKD